MHPILKRVLGGRGVCSSQELSYDFQELPEPSSMKDIGKGARLLANAIIKKEKIVIVGDYDVDGATSTVLARNFFEKCGLNDSSFIIPSRIHDGYGLSPKIIPQIIKYDPQLVITVDNGIKSHAALKLLKHKGITTIVCDHHIAEEELPEADAIINPNRKDCPFIAKNLAGVGVCFYLVCAVRKELINKKYFLFRSVPPPNMAQYLDLVAIGTIADIVPMDKVNRILVERGLRRIRSGKTLPGIKALFGNNNLLNLGSEDIAFKIAPLLNSAGRLDDMSVAMDCLLSNSMDEAIQKTKELEQINRKRKQLTNKMKEDAQLMLNQSQWQNCNSISLYNKEWHPGLTGLLAGYIKDTYNLPSAIFAKQLYQTDKERYQSLKEKPIYIKASLRSIEGVSVHNLLQKISITKPGLIERFGGHANAAGITIKENNFEEFSSCFEEILGKFNKNTSKQSSPYILSDGELAPDNINNKTAIMLHTAAPWGKDFPAPLFDGEFKIIKQELNSNSHLKMQLAQKASNQPINAFYFNYGTYSYPIKSQYIKIAYRLMLPAYGRKQNDIILAIEYMEEL